MGTCMICGTPVDGRICESHQEDVVFEFRGDSADQLTPNRFYTGIVDGYADFGVFVDLAPGVTGLLHRSELDRRLESLDWEPGDTVFVQVKNVRDNGNIDLGWSIRQSEREFRGALVQDADGDHEPEGSDDDSSEAADATEGSG
ncbi:S1 RNA-binding domain-containing protein, partial [Halobium palmae]